MKSALDWLGCATFRLVIDDVVVLLDAYLDRIPGAASSGVEVNDIERCDWIVVGHSHFDHLWGAERIAVATGATVIGSYETVRVLRRQGVPSRQLWAVSGGERVRLGPDLMVSVLPGLHSCVWSAHGMPDADEPCLGDLSLTYQEQAERMTLVADRLLGLGDDAQAHLAKADQKPRGDGGALVYVFETPDGSVLYQDSAGYWSGMFAGLRPDVAILSAAGRGNIDGQPVQGTLADFVAGEALALGARKVILSHHDDWLPGFSKQLDVDPVRRAIERLTPHAEFLDVEYVEGRALF